MRKERIFWAGVFGIFIFGALCFGATITVNWDGSGDYTTIQDAIDATVNGDEVVVADGIYFGNISFDGKDIFLTSTNPEDPNVVETTVIDGGGYGSVVTFAGSESSDCVLTGFTIRGGDGYKGGGIQGNGSNALVSRCVITDNTAEAAGGGVQNLFGEIRYCTLIGNDGGGAGGGLEGCTGFINNCMIANNDANDGGGLYNCNGTISNCTITGNISSSWGWGGGGLYDCDGMISNCMIANNDANDGGGLYDCDGTIRNCTITCNTADRYGGGLRDCRGTILNCIIVNNVADYGDQLYYSSFPTYCCIEDWSGGGEGNIDVDPLFVDELGGDYHLQPDSPCIDAGDPEFICEPDEVDIDGEPRVMGGRIDMGADEVVPNEPYLFAFPKELEFLALEEGASPESQTFVIRNVGIDTLSWSISEECEWLTVVPETGQSSGEEDEVTVSIDMTGLEGGQYECELTVSSPEALNSPEVVKVTLLIRPVNAILEVPEIFWSIQSAINASADGCTIIVNEGTYYENINFGGKNIVLSSTNPDDPNATVTIIDGGGAGSVVTFAGSEKPNCVLTGFTITSGRNYAFPGGGICGSGTEATISNCIVIYNTADEGGGIGFCEGIINNCVISNNKTRGGNFSWRGGGLYDCDGTISNCTITENTANYGGGLYDCNAEISNCTIKANTAWYDGGGLRNCDGTISNCLITGNATDADGGGLRYCNGTISNCLITDNRADIDGGGLYDCDGQISNCTIKSNTAWDDGGGLYYCDGMISNCIISDNKADDDGGGLYYCDGMISNCIISGNKADDYCGGLGYCDGEISNCTITCNTGADVGGIYECDGIIVNCIIVDNIAEISGGQILGSSIPTYSCINDWKSGGVGNIDANPEFVDAANGDYHLMWDSPCVDAGDPNFVPEEGEVDTDGEHRVMGGRVDMGADEVGPKQADFTRDGVINVDDFGMLGNSWGTGPGGEKWYVLCDLWEDGIIDITDLAAFAEDWMWEADWHQ